MAKIHKNPASSPGQREKVTLFPGNPGRVRKKVQRTRKHSRKVKTKNRL